jgi:hypothetical protein
MGLQPKAIIMGVGLCHKGLDAHNPCYFLMRYAYNRYVTAHLENLSVDGRIILTYTEVGTECVDCIQLPQYSNQLHARVTR